MRTQTQFSQIYALLPLSSLYCIRSQVTSRAEGGFSKQVGSVVHPCSAGIAKFPPVGRWIWRFSVSVGQSLHACLLLRKPKVHVVVAGISLTPLLDRPDPDIIDVACHGSGQFGRYVDANRDIDPDV